MMADRDIGCRCGSRRLAGAPAEIANIVPARNSFNFWGMFCSLNYAANGRGIADRTLMMRSYHSEEVPVDIARRLGCHVRFPRMWPPASQTFTNVDFPQFRRPLPALEKRAANVLLSARRRSL